MITLRKAEHSDIDLLVSLRFDYITEDMGSLSDEEKDVMEKQLRPYFDKHITDDTFIAVLAEENGEVVSTAYLAVCKRPANPKFINGRIGTFLNVFTCTEHRRKGISTQVVNRIIEEAKRLEISRIELSATDDGKTLYEKLGFKNSRYSAMNMDLLGISFIE